jgi:hypothetical protein
VNKKYYISRPTINVLSPFFGFTAVTKQEHFSGGMPTQTIFFFNKKEIQRVAQ